MSSVLLRVTVGDRATILELLEEELRELVELLREEEAARPAVFMEEQKAPRAEEFFQSFLGVLRSGVAGLYMRLLPEEAPGPVGGPGEAIEEGVEDPS